jgi:hypothetical protein
MKKILAILMACLLLCSAAAAENVAAVYQFISPNGYSMLVDASVFEQCESLVQGADMFTEVVPEGETSKLMILIAPTAVPNEQADSYIMEAVANYNQEMVSEKQYVELETGLKYYTVSAQDKGINFIFYAIEGNGGLLCITVAYPAAMEMDYAGPVLSMIDTIIVLNPEMEYVSDAGFTLRYDESLMRPTVFADTEHDYFVSVAQVGGTSAASLLMVKSDVAWDQAEGYLAEAVSMFEQTNDAQLVEGDVTYMTRTAVEAGMVYRYYAVKAGDGMICCTALFPENDASFADIFNDMIESMMIK